MAHSTTSAQARGKLSDDSRAFDSAALSDEAAEFADAVLSGLTHVPRSIPSRFLYDETGSALFEEITKLDEYYPTRTEMGLLLTHGAEIADAAGDVDTLVEFGSGSSRKTRLLIEALEGLRTYVPIDVSEAFLAEAAQRLKADCAGLTVTPVVGDFTKTRNLDRVPAGRRLGFFSGSTIGNLTHEESHDFLVNASRLLGHGSTFLIGVDLKKSLDTLIPAYDDAQGATASFSLNLLARINRELGGDFDTGRFAHRALYNAAEDRIEINLESLAEQTVHVLGQSFFFAKGERIHTENSHKYSVEGFQALAWRAGWMPVHAWTDEANLFSLHLLRVN